MYAPNVCVAEVETTIGNKTFVYGVSKFIFKNFSYCALGKDKPKIWAYDV